MPIAEARARRVRVEMGLPLDFLIRHDLIWTFHQYKCIYVRLDRTCSVESNDSRIAIDKGANVRTQSLFRFYKAAGASREHIQLVA